MRGYDPYTIDMRRWLKLYSTHLHCIIINRQSYIHCWGLPWMGKTVSRRATVEISVGCNLRNTWLSLSWPWMAISNGCKANTIITQCNIVCACLCSCVSTCVRGTPCVRTCVRTVCVFIRVLNYMRVFYMCLGVGWRGVWLTSRVRLLTIGMFVCACLRAYLIDFICVINKQIDWLVGL
jgi:hypothetical protein